MTVGVYKIFPYHLIFSVKELVREKISERNKEHRIEIFEKFSPQVDMVFVGDSLTEYGEWNDFFPLKKSSNRGVAGDTAKDIMLRMDSIHSTKAKKAFLMVGINDIYANILIKKILKNYEKIITSLKGKNFEVIVQSTIQCQIEICGEERILKVNLLNKELKALSKNMGVSFLNLDALSAESGLNKDFTYDGIHLNAFGYQYWASKIDSKFDNANS
tara:strand:+ start:171 stop:818 length:648 start_codon:yes stop_codon:yes gene_type:complete